MARDAGSLNAVKFVKPAPSRSEKRVLIRTVREKSAYDDAAATDLSPRVPGVEIFERSVDRAWSGDNFAIDAVPRNIAV